jgi:N-acetylglucosamine kinase-like BadF-type ATPase
MILIADSGSTKTDWILTDENKNQTRYNTIGYNPYFIDSESIYASLTLKLIPQLNAEAVKMIFFYGAGCSTSEKSEIVHKALSRCFPNSELSVEHDLLGAARALLGNKRGFAAIIGTGSNTSIYDGSEIETNIDSLGYLLGDEGSGCYIGKKIIRDFIRGYLPSDLKDKFNQTYNYSNAEIYDFIYNKPLPNRFLAGFCKFADENKEHEHIKKIVRESFNDFFKKLVSKYEGYEKYTFNSVGSVGYVFKDILEEVARSYKMETGKNISSPIESLVNYHLNKNN